MKNKYNSILISITVCVYIFVYIYIESNIAMDDFTKYNYRYSTTRAFFIIFPIYAIGRLIIKIYLNSTRKKNRNKVKVVEVFRDCTYEVILVILSLILSICTA